MGKPHKRPRMRIGSGSRARGEDASMGDLNLMLELGMVQSIVTEYSVRGESGVEFGKTFDSVTITRVMLVCCKLLFWRLLSRTRQGETRSLQ